LLKRSIRADAVALAVAGCVMLVAAAVALAVTGDLTQPAGSGGCVSTLGAGSCATGHALNYPYGVAVSPDGRSVYVASYKSDAVARLNRNPLTGAISQPSGKAGCISQTGAGSCAPGHGLSHPRAVTVSPDGRSVYVAAPGSSAVVRLNRNTTTGAISESAGNAGCISQTGAGPCAHGHALEHVRGVAVSPDGRSVYVTATRSDAVVRLNRNTTTGAISQPSGKAGCISQTGSGSCADGHALVGPSGVVVSPDRKSVYLDAYNSGAVVRLKRDPLTGAISQPSGRAGCISQTGAGPCANGHALSPPSGVAVSRNGKSIYVTSYYRTGSSYTGAVARLNRNPLTGAISQPSGKAGCVSDKGAGNCARGHALRIPNGVVVSPDGKSLYVASYKSDAVARLNRNRLTGAISQPTGKAGCVSQTGAGPCAQGHALHGPAWVAISPDGKSIYATSRNDDAVDRFIRAP
jgi:DNA-binding beta-propeller fold protein YncE